MKTRILTAAALAALVGFGAPSTGHADCKMPTGFLAQAYVAVTGDVVTATAADCAHKLTGNPLDKALEDATKPKSRESRSKREEPRPRIFLGSRSGG